MDKKENSSNDLDSDDEVKINVLMELFYKLLVTFSKYINDSDNVPWQKYAEFVIFMMAERLKDDQNGKKVDSSGN